MGSMFGGRTPGPRSAARARLVVSGVILGVAFSGFFDGILLHQILQWHHLLSLVPGPAFQDPRVQIAADGGFHLLMYGLAAVGLVLLWKDAAKARPTPSFWRSFIIGFGAWNIADTVLFHWLLEWHHIRLNTQTPLLWDLGWVVAFGVAPLAAALIGPIGHGRMGASTLTVITVVILASGAWAARPPKDATTLVLFAPSATPANVTGAIAAVDGRLIAIDASGTLVAAQLPRPAAGWRLYRSGALLVSTSGLAGCAAWSQPGARRNS